MKQTLESTTQEFLNGFSPVTNRNTVLITVAQSVLKKLGENYQNLEMQENIGGDSLIDLLVGGSSYIKGYSIREKTPLQTPKNKQSLFRLLKQTRTHEIKELCYLDSPDPYSASGIELLVRVNEKPVIKACEEIAKRIARNVSVKYTF